MNAGMRAAEKKQMEQQTALGRLGTAEDIADAGKGVRTEWHCSV
jgi:hypothetical protein